jgi:hypothetical protein
MLLLPTFLTASAEDEWGRWDGLKKGKVRQWGLDRKWRLHALSSGWQNLKPGTHVNLCLQISLRTVEELVGSVAEDDWHSQPRWKRIPSLEAGALVSCQAAPLHLYGKMHQREQPACMLSPAPTKQHCCAGQPPQRTPSTITSSSAVALELEAQQMLPAIWFIFSRRDCDLAAQHLEMHGVTLTTPQGALPGALSLRCTERVALPESAGGWVGQIVQASCSAAALLTGFSCSISMSPSSSIFTHLQSAPPSRLSWTPWQLISRRRSRTALWSRCCGGWPPTTPAACPPGRAWSSDCSSEVRNYAYAVNSHAISPFLPAHC